MGYESRVYVVNENGFYYGEQDKPIGECIGVMNLCSCSGKFLEVFKDEATHNLYESHDGVDYIISQDKYGDTLKSANIVDVIDAIEDGNYWRTDALKGMLVSIVESYKNKNLTRDFDELKVYHFGY